MRPFSSPGWYTDGYYCIALCVINCCGDSLDAMDYFGHKHEEYPREFLELPNGILDADTIRRVFERLDARELAHV